MKRIFAVAFLCFTVVCIVLSYKDVSLVQATQASAENKIINSPIIVIDCGHGGEDGGAVSFRGLLEKDVNLQIGLILQKLMTQSGFEVIMIRSTDTSVADSDKITLREKKVSDLKNRVRIINSNEHNVLISIHQNFFEDSRYSGAQVFFSNNTESSKELAECIRLAVKGLLQNDNNRESKAASKDIYILKNAQVPSVLVECGFLSNDQEEKKLRTAVYREQIAFCIYAGFLEYYYQNY